MSLEEVENILKCDKIMYSMLYHINNQQEQDENITILNKTLSLSKYRLKGLELLSANIRSLPTEVVLKNASLWLNICVGQHHKSLKEVKLSVIAEIIERADDDQDFTKKLLSDYMTKILDICLSSHVNTYEVGGALTILSVCMKRYGSWFGSHKSKIEIFLLNFLFSPSNSLVEKAAEAFLHLQRVGGAGVDGINHRSNFSLSFHKLCTTTQKLFDKLFENETEVDQYDVTSDEGYSLPESMSDTSKIVTCLGNCFKFIKTMMLKGFHVKEIMTVQVLDLILRGTSLHFCITGSGAKSFEDIELSISVNAIQIKLIELLNVFIIWCQRILLPFSNTIIKILIDCLLRSQKCKCFKINSRYRETVYNVLNCWISVSRCAFHRKFNSKLIDCILEDITSTKREIKLIVNNDKKSVPKKRVRESITTGTNSSSRLVSDPAILQEHKNCCAALTTLKCLLRSGWLTVNTDQLEVLYTTVLGSALDVVTMKYIHPYTNSSCQQKLFDVLVTFYEESSLSVFPNINVAEDILLKGRNSKQLKISSVCERGLGFLEILCQPICPSLYSSENSSGKELHNNEKLFNVTSEDLPEIDVLSNDPSGISDDVNNESKSLENSEIAFNHAHTVEFNKELPETIQDECTEMRDVVKEHPVHILDVKIVKPSLSSEYSESTSNIAISQVQTGNIALSNEVCESTSKIAISEVRTENINIDDEVVDESENHESNLSVNMNVEQVSAHISLEDANNDIVLQIEGEDIDEQPPTKIIKLEMKSEELDDEFVDQVKEY